jgi:hypothetical protein
MSGSRNNEAKTRGRPFQPGNSTRFQPGNPGRPPGSRHKATIAAEALLDGQAEALTQKAIEAALGGDSAALRLCLDRLIPPRRERSVKIALPPLKKAEDAAAAMAAILAAVAEGELSLGEAESVVKLVELFVRSLEASEFERRIRALEERAGDRYVGRPRAVSVAA